MNKSVQQWYKSSKNQSCEPQKYQNVLIKPFFLKDRDEYFNMIRYFQMTKSHISDIGIKTMTNLKYLLFIYPVLSQMPDKDDKNKKKDDIVTFEIVEKDIIDILKSCLIVENKEITDIFIWKDFRNKEDTDIRKTDFAHFCEDINKKIKLNVTLVLKDKYIKEDEDYEESMIKLTDIDFDNIREIILEQNGIDVSLLEEYDPTLEPKLKFAHRGNNTFDLDEQIYTFANYMRIHTKQVLNEYTFFLLDKYLSYENTRIDYIVYKPLETSGQISFKDKKQGFKHWFAHKKKKRRYDDILVQKQEFIKKNDFLKDRNEINKK